MRHVTLIIFFAACVILPVGSQITFSPDSLMDRVAGQFSIYPQEKIHLHIDKPAYTSGDTIWFKIYPVHATFHVPFKLSRYVYTELIDPLDSVVSRVKIRLADDSCHGYMALPEQLADGNYTLRAYTMYMKNYGEDYFFQREVHIVSSVWRNRKVQANTIPGHGGMGLSLRFLGETGSRITPQDAVADLKDGKRLTSRIEKDKSIHVVSNNRDREENKAMKLDFTDASDYNYQKFMPLSTDNEAFHVGFYPEGGYLLTGVPCKVTFKATGLSGHGADVQITITDSRGEVVATANTLYEGMGSFVFTPVEGEEYTARCTNKYSLVQSVVLPQSQAETFSLKVEQAKDYFMVSVQSASKADPAAPLYLVAHVRGAIVFADAWGDKEKPLAFGREMFPAGVIQFLLLDEEMNPISERLAFSKNYTRVNSNIITNKDEYGKREKIAASINIMGESGNPLSGNLSVAVTDGNTVVADTCHNMPSVLLLSSELKGYIANPAFYLQQTARADLCADLLMTTQGWRRYKLPEIFKGSPEKPRIEPETHEQVSGVVGTQRRLLFKQSDEHIVYISGIARGAGYVDMVNSSKEGAFRFDSLDFSEGTGFRLEAIQVKGKKTEEVMIDEKEYPGINIRIPQFQIQEDALVETQPAEYDYFRKIGDNHFLLSTLEVRAPYWGSTNYEEFSEADLGRFRVPDLWEMLMEMGFEIVEHDNSSLQEMSLGKDNGMGAEENRPFQDVIDNNAIRQNLNPLIKGLVASIDFSRNSLRYQGNYVVVFVDNNYSSGNDILGHLTAGDIQEMVLIKDVEVSLLNDLVRGDRNWLLGEAIRRDAAQVLFNIPPSQKTVPVLNIKTIDSFDSRFFGWYSGSFDIARMSQNRKTIFPLGYQLPAEFYSPVYETPRQKENKDADTRSTIFWKPDIETDAGGNATFSFYASDIPATYTLVIEGITDKGDIIFETRNIKVK